MDVGYPMQCQVISTFKSNNIHKLVIQQQEETLKQICILYSRGFWIPKNV